MEGAARTGSSNEKHGPNIVPREANDVLPRTGEEFALGILKNNLNATIVNDVLYVLHIRFRYLFTSPGHSSQGLEGATPNPYLRWHQDLLHAEAS